MFRFLDLLISIIHGCFYTVLYKENEVNEKSEVNSYRLEVSIGICKNVRVANFF